MPRCNLFSAEGLKISKDEKIIFKQATQTDLVGTDIDLIDTQTDLVGTQIDLLATQTDLIGTQIDIVGTQID